MADKEEIEFEIDEADLENYGDDEKAEKAESRQKDTNEIKFDDTIKFDDEEYEPAKENSTDTKSIADIDNEIDNIARELGLNNKETEPDTNDNSADNNGSIIDNNELMDEDYKIVPKDNDFISSTGEIVVMDNNDNDDNFKLIYVDIKKIAIVKRIRESTNVEDLVKSIKSTGLLKPVDVAPTSADGVYVLLDGYRRILACARAGKRRIPCVINTRVNVPEIPVLEALYNHSKQYSIKEMIDYIDYLEKQKGIMSASMIEYLLQMNSGDYTKLKDILNDNDDDIVSKLMNGQYTIDMAFRKLEQRRKKESTEEKEIKKATKVYDDAAESGVENIAESGEIGNDDTALTDEEIKSLAISASDFNNLQDESLEDMITEANSIEGFKPHKQDPNERERLDPALRKAVLARDNNTCQFCKSISGEEYVEVLDVHHIQEVYLGGTDEISNLIVACTCCHKLIHLFARGELYTRPLDEYTEEEREKFKKIIKAGTLIRKGMALKGMKKDELKKVDRADSIGRRLKGSSDQLAG